MKIGALKEGFAGEARVAITPSSATHLRKLGHEAFVESGAGAAAGFSDDDYRAAGVGVEPDAAALIGAVERFGSLLERLPLVREIAGSLLIRARKPRS